MNRGLVVANTQFDKICHFFHSRAQRNEVGQV